MATTIDPRKIEQRRDRNQPPTQPRRRGEIVVADGYGVRVRVERGQLVVEDGAGRNRQTRPYSRATSRLERLVILSGTGYLSLEALRWLKDIGAGLICIDRDGRLLCTSAPTRSEAKLRRAQALAPFTPAGLEVARFLLAAKLKGQQELLDRLPHDPNSRNTLADSLQAIQTGRTVQELVQAEAEAAAAYWPRWRQVPVRFQPRDRTRTPNHWTTFGPRMSPLTSGPRLAITPAGAILNYLYSLLEAETRLACLQIGLDPALAIVHADTRSRDSLPLDLMEAARPNVDRYLLALLHEQTFRLSDFHNTPRGSCRILPPLTHQLAQTLPAWRQLLAPITEHVARLLIRSAPTAESPPTPLTQQNRRSDRARRHNRPIRPATATQPKPTRHCKRCGGPLPHRERVYCDDCLPHYQHDHSRALAALGRTKKQQLREQGADPSHGGQAGDRRGATIRRHLRELRDWQTVGGSEPFDPMIFAREILPRIQTVPISDLVRATGLSYGYLAQVRRGLKIPHRRHWSALQNPASV